MSVLGEIEQQSEELNAIGASERARSLVTQHNNDAFACGEWESDDDTPYSKVLLASHKSEVELLRYIAELEAKAGVK